MAFATLSDPYARRYDMAPGETLDGFVDLPTYQDGMELEVSVSATGTVTHSAAFVAPQRSIILRGAGASFVGSTRPRRINLRYSQNGANFFWVQAE